MKNEIEINGETYIKKEALNSLIYVIVRTYSAGCFAGYLDSYGQSGTEINLINARRLWYWDGASSLSQLAMEGVSRPENCKFPCEVEKIKLMGVIEVINATEKARKCIAEVPIWHQ
jgi:hypothetical protein